MKKKQITGKNTFRKLAIDPSGRLIDENARSIDGTKDVTEKDLARIRYHKLQSEQFETLPEFKVRNVIQFYAIFCAILVLFFVFACIALKYLT